MIRLRIRYTLPIRIQIELNIFPSKFQGTYNTFTMQ